MSSKQSIQVTVHVATLQAEKRRAGMNNALHNSPERFLACVASPHDMIFSLPLRLNLCGCDWFVAGVECVSDHRGWTCV